jgi:PAS domain S-box-containing protein
MAVKIAVAYVLLGALWILCSGQILHHFVQEPELESVLETVKGWFYVLVTGLLLAVALDRYFRDIRRSAQLLQASEQRWQFALQGAGQGVWDWNAQTNEVFRSAGWKSMLGFAPQEMGDSLAEWETRIHPEDLPRVRQEIGRHLEGQTPLYSSEHRVRCKDGSYKWALGQGQVISRTADGKPLRVVGIYSEITERKQGEVALRKSRQQLAEANQIMAGVLEHTHMMAAFLDPKFNFIWVNRAYAATCQHEQAFFPGKNHFKLYPHAENQAIFAWVVETGEPFFVAAKPFEFPDQPERGVTYWDWSLIPVKDAAGKVSGLVFTLADVTERMRMEQALRESEERFRTLVETAPEAIFIRHGPRFAYLNAAALRLLGAQSPTELLGEPVVERFHPNCRAQVSERMRALDECGQSAQTADQVFLKLDGSPVPVIVSAVPFTYRNQRAALVFARDDSERTRAKGLLEESLLFRRQAEKIGRIGAWKVNPKTDYCYWTEGVREIVEAPPDYEPGLEEAMKFYDAESLPLLREGLQRALADGTPFVVEAGLTTMKGKHLWTEVRGLGRLGDNDQAFVMGTLQDITERKRLESQLRQSQKIEAIGQLAGGVAHDFNNILAAIMMRLGLLQMRPNLDPEMQHALHDLDAAARRAAGLTRQLLMFSRRSVLAVKPLDLNEVVVNLLRMLRRLIGEHIDLRFDGKSALPLVEADAGMMEQVLMNLAVNARDAMPQGGRISISTTVAILDLTQSEAHPSRRPGHFVCLEVSDTGCGMDKGTLKRIFEPFFTTKEPGKGTGLGLATVHGIVAQHKGWVEVDSQVGAGTTFRVYLPAAVQTHLEIAPPEPAAPVQGGRETIMLVEDDLPVRQAVAESLRTLGYRVHEAGNGQEAMALWQVHGRTVDLLLTDMVMPEGMTGMELTEQLQSLKPRLKAIISSGYSAELAHAGRPTRAGVIYLPKPYVTNVLADVIRESLDQRN